MSIETAVASYKFGRTALGAMRTTQRWLAKVMFYRTLKIAHEAWLESRALGVEWEEIGEGIEISESFARWPEGPKDSHLGIRSMCEDYDSGTVVVEAIRRNVVFDETRVVSGLDKRIRIIKLPGIPAFETYITKDNKDIDQTYDDYVIRITSLTKDGVTRPANLRTLISSPLDITLAQPHLWKRVGDEIFHIGEIVWAKEALRDRVWQIVPSRLVASMITPPAFWIPKILRIQRLKPTVLAEFTETRRRLAEQRRTQRLEQIKEAKSAI